MTVKHLISVSSGGAHNVAKAINRASNSEGIDSDIIEIGGGLSAVLAGVERRLLMSSDARQKNLFMHLNYGFGGIDIPKGTLVHFHWSAGSFVGLKTIEAISRTNTVIITLHDLGYVTGGCHTPIGCSQFNHGCTKCPLSRNQLSQLLISRRRGFCNKLQSNKNIHWAAPSHFIAEWIDSYNRYIIPNPINFPILKKKQKVVYDAVFFADKKNWYLKGFDRIEEIISQNSHNWQKVAIIGDRFDIPFDGIDIVNFGFIPREMVTGIFREAKEFQLTSRFESFSLMAHEAIMCGCEVKHGNLDIANDLVRAKRNAEARLNGESSNFGETTEEKSDFNDYVSLYKCLMTK